MRAVSKYQKTLRHFGRSVGAFVLAMDTDSSELLYFEISKLKQEIADLKAGQGASTEHEEAA